MQDSRPLQGGSFKFLSMIQQAQPKLFLLLLGSKAPGRNVEKHDYFFGIANNLKELIPAVKIFWPEAGNTIHLDGGREVNNVERYAIKVVLKEKTSEPSIKKLFFINLGGYQTGKLEEQHYTLLTVQEDRGAGCSARQKDDIL